MRHLYFFLISLSLICFLPGMSFAEHDAGATSQSTHRRYADPATKVEVVTVPIEKEKPIYITTGVSSKGPYKGLFCYKVIMMRKNKTTGQIEPDWEEFGDKKVAEDFMERAKKDGYYSLIKFTPPNGRDSWVEPLVDSRK